MFVLGVGIQFDSQKFLYTRLLAVKDGSVQLVARLQVTVRDSVGRSLRSLVPRATAPMDDIRCHLRSLSLVFRLEETNLATIFKRLFVS